MTEKVGYRYGNISQWRRRAQLLMCLSLMPSSYALLLHELHIVQQ